ncbi:DUF3238 domain-containing protein [Domibacillus epiphyticus]|uniref:Fibronectin type-III domain-containing protein n=1 Tax=Domibacillus epiphyticus TaxID=1714355 RepID=A0A1V2AAB1_9BACI|nr:DUF3238 domain-containing protein [Domibacillus epiphyticus]OMP67897.1 hypothetical protein BTO28_05260 [Domibacillus epiphyticus]
MNIQSVSQTPDSITFSWTGAGQSYRIWKDGVEVYNGPDTEFTDSGLRNGTLYSYVIEGEQLLKIQTATAVERKNKNSDIPLQELIVTTVVKDNEIAIAWEEIKGVKQYEIYRNNEYAGTVKKAGFQDTNLDNDEIYTYRIKAKRVMEFGEEDGTSEPSLFSRLLRLIKFTENEDDMLVETFFIDKEIGRLGSHLTHKPVDIEKDYFIRYTTFLKDKWILNPVFLSKIRFFAGDNRGYNADSKRYRTRADVTVKGETVSLARDVGASEGYSWNKKMIKRDTASDEGIEIKSIRQDEEKLAFTLLHSVGNPLVAAPAIVYEVYMTFYHNGVFDFSGEHDEAPHHEVYMKRGKDSWKPLHLSKSRGLDRLAPPTANRFWRVSNLR